MYLQTLNKNQFINLSSFLIYLLPLALLTGPFIPDLFITLLSIIFVYFSIKEKKWFYYQNLYSYLFIIIYFYFVMRSIFTINPADSLSVSIPYIRFIFFSLATWWVIDNNKNFIKNFSIILTIIFIVALFDGYYQYFYDVNFFGFHAPGSRMSLLLNDKAILGGYLSRLFPLLMATTIYRIISNNNKKNLYTIFIILIPIMFIFTDILIYITGERTAFALLFLSTIFIVISVSKFKIIRLISFLLSLLIIIFITTQDKEIKNRNIDYTISQLNSTEEGKFFLFSEKHEKYFFTSWNMFLDNKLFGQGPNLFRQLCSKEKFSYAENSCNTHPHNNYIQLLAETGIFVPLIFIIIFLSFIYLSIINVYNLAIKNKIIFTDYQICLISCFLMTLWPILPTNNFYNNWINIIYFLPVGFFLNSIYKDNIKSK